LRIKCHCGCEFTTSAHSYKNARKSGCPACKAASTSAFWKGKERKPMEDKIVSNLAKKERRKNPRIPLDNPQRSQDQLREVYYAFPDLFNSIKNKQDLIYHLEQNPNEYNDFMLKCIKIAENSKDLSKDWPAHHIIPIFAGGPDVSWNRCPVTPENHAKAHELRFKVYGNPYDELATRFLLKFSKLSEAERKEMSEKSKKAQKEAGIGFNDKKQQAKSGQKGGKKQTR
jgi:hypothetical protein